MSNVSWAVDKIHEHYQRTLQALIDGDDTAAGLNAARVVTFTNAVARVSNGKSPDLARDPLFGRYFNDYEYFQNPRAATSDDDLGTIDDWSI